MEKLMVVVKMWGGDMALFRQAAEQVPVGPIAVSRLIEEVEMRNKAKLEIVGEQTLFLASYPLGSKLGYKEYETVLFNRIESRGGVVNGRTIIFDPSKRNGYSRDVVHNGEPRRIVGNPNANVELYIVGDALNRLFPGAAITESLDPVLRRLSFIGASNFWWSMRGALDDEGFFNLSTFFRNTRNSRQVTHAQLHALHVGEPDDMLDIYDKSFFNARWTFYVLTNAFGVMLTNGSGNNGADMTFTPYNGSVNGPDHNRFSWTLGTAALLASHNLRDLAPLPVGPIRAP